MLLTILSMLSGVCLFAGIHHLWIGARRPCHPAHLWFALLSFCVTAYVLSKIAAYGAGSVDDLVTARRIELSFAAITLSFLPWFVAAYTAEKARLLLLIHGAFGAVVFVANMALPWGLSFVDAPNLQYFTLPWGEQVVDLRVHHRSGWYDFSWLFVLLSFVLSAYFCMRLYRRGERQRAAALAITLCLFLAFVLFNRVVNLGLVNFTHTAEFGFIALVVLMGTALSRELRSAATALTASESRFRAITEHAADAIYMLDLDGRFITANPQGCVSLGYTRDELLRMNVDEIEVEIDPARIRKLWREMQPEVPLTFNGTNRRKDGSTFPTEIRVALFQIEGRTLALAIVRDISERKHAEAALRKSDTLLLEAQRLGKMGSWNLDLRTGAVTWSDEVYRIFEVDKNTFVLSYESYLTLIHPDDRQHLDTVYQAHLQNRTPYVVEHRLLLAGGRIKFVLGRGETEYIDNQPVRTFGMVQDVTERVVSEQSLRVSERRMRQAVHMAQLGIWDWDMTADITTWQGEMFNIYGITPAQFTGKATDYLNFTREDFRAQRDANIVKILANGMTEAQLARGDDLPLPPQEMCIVRPDGTEVFTLNEALAIVDEQGNPQRLVGVSMNITERKRAEQEILALNTQLEGRVRDRTLQLEAAYRELEAFSYSVSHDLRAPLRGIDGFSHLLAEDYAPQLDATARSYVERIRKATVHMGKLIDDMLNLSRLSRAQLLQQPADLSLLAQETVTALEQLDPDRAVTVVIAPGMTAAGDVTLLRVVLMNLLGNAWKYTRHTAQPHIEFGASECNGERFFFVRDNGAGFDMQYAGKLFGPFQRLHSAQDFEGSGIGLATVARIVARHGGRIWAESAVDAGATFYFTLPE